jgi:hypothetical protein
MSMQKSIGFAEALLGTLIAEPYSATDIEYTILPSDF